MLVVAPMMGAATLVTGGASGVDGGDGDAASDGAGNDGIRPERTESNCGMAADEGQGDEIGKLAGASRAGADAGVASNAVAVAGVAGRTYCGGTTARGGNVRCWRSSRWVGVAVDGGGAGAGVDGLIVACAGPDVVGCAGVATLGPGSSLSDARIAVGYRCAGESSGNSASEGLSSHALLAQPAADREHSQKIADVQRNRCDSIRQGRFKRRMSTAFRRRGNSVGGGSYLAPQSITRLARCMHRLPPPSEERLVRTVTLTDGRSKDAAPMSLPRR